MNEAKSKKVRKMMNEDQERKKMLNDQLKAQEESEKKMNKWQCTKAKR